MKSLELADGLLESVHEALAIQVKIENAFVQSEIVESIYPTISKGFWHSFTLQEANMYLNFIDQSIKMEDHSGRYSAVTQTKKGIRCIDLACNRKINRKKFPQKLTTRQIVDIITGTPVSSFLIEQLDWTW